MDDALPFDSKGVDYIGVVILVTLIAFIGLSIAFIFKYCKSINNFISIN